MSASETGSFSLKVSEPGTLPQLEKLDLLWGVSEIARAISRTERQTVHMCANGELPVRKVGGRYVVERAQLIAFFTGKAA